MQKKIFFETDRERFLRERSENVQKDYLSYSRDILTGHISPNRVIQYLARRYCMSGEGVKSILKRHGVYKSAKQPVILCKIESERLSMFPSELSVSSCV